MERRRAGREWFLDDAEELHRRYPDTFEIPPVERRAGLQIGDFATLVFRFPAEDGAGSYDHGERMWVRITEACGGRYVGRLDSDPLKPPARAAIALGDLVEFGPEHVIDIFAPGARVGPETSP